MLTLIIILITMHKLIPNLYNIHEYINKCWQRGGQAKGEAAENRSDPNAERLAKDASPTSCRAAAGIGRDINTYIYIYI